MSRPTSARLPLALALRLALAVLAISAACNPAPRPHLAQLVLVSSEKISESETEYTFEVVIHNPLEAIEEVLAIATPLDAERTTAIDGESRTEEQIPARTTFTSKDTVTIRRLAEKPDETPYTGADLRWEVTYRLVGPPPNRPPLAGAGYGPTVQAGDLVRLDGSASGDPDGNPIHYSWSFASLPAGSTAQLSPPDAMLTSFVPDLPGTYLVQLVVDDGLLSSTPALMGITVLPLDPNPPSVQSHYPEADATLVATNARISAHFSEWLDAASVDASTFSLVGLEGAVAARSVRASGNVAIFEPAAPLRSNATYRVTLAATISDRQGQPLGVAVEWWFSTGNEIDVDPPQIFSIAPVNGATGVVTIRQDAISVQFTDTIDQTSLAGRFTVSQLGGTEVPGRVELVDGGVRARFVPTQPAGAGQTWTATVAPGVLDTSGNALVQGTSWSFQTLPSHPLWLSRPGPGSSSETESYYANLPIRTGAFWDDPDPNDPWWEPGWKGGWGSTPATFADWLWDLGWSPVGEPRAVFYDATDLAVGRNARCFVSGTPAGVAPGGSAAVPPDAGSPSAFFGHTQIGCYASNHGPIPGDPDHPQRDPALADAVHDRDATSISAIFSRYDAPRSEQTISVPSNYTYRSGEQEESQVVYRGDVVTIGPAAGTIWAGNLWFGRNDANGIVGWTCDDSENCPHPGQRLYGLFVHTPAGQLLDGTPISGWRFLGTSSLTFKVLTGGVISFDINDEEPRYGDGAFDVPLRVERANAVSFMLYVPDGTGSYRLARTANLDGEGPKPVPQACLACHGGSWDPDTQSVTGASLLPLDPSRLSLPTTPGFTRTAQEEAFREINEMIRRTQSNRPDAAGPVRTWIDGAYASRVDVPGQTANDAWVPSGWSGDTALYRNVAKPYCLSCHQALAAPLDLDSAAEFRALGAAIRNDVCVERSMPHAGPSFERFWQSGAVDALRQALFGGAACGP